MKLCYCIFILALLVIVFAWWSVSWAPIALTIIGAILAIMALSHNKCCCCKSKEEKKE
jgi:hypothetical protein